MLRDDTLLIADIDFHAVGEAENEGLKLIDFAGSHHNVQVLLTTGHARVEYAFDGAIKGAFGIFSKNAAYEAQIMPLIKGALSAIRLSRRHARTLHELQVHKFELARSILIVKFLFRSLEFIISIAVASCVVLLLRELVTGSSWRFALFAFVAVAACVFFERISRFVLGPKGEFEILVKQEKGKTSE